jgi:hypothetical protein
MMEVRGMSNAIFVLTPGFSPVRLAGSNRNRFNGFSSVRKPLKRLSSLAVFYTRLKPGVNGTSETPIHSRDHQ